MRIRITIEYDTDDETTTVESERHDWLNGAIDVADVVGTYADCGGIMTLEIAATPQK